MSLICHITTAAEWDAAKPSGQYASTSLKDEGFIHCCLPEQVPSILERYFQGKKNLVKLNLESDLLTSQLIYEWSPSVQQTFPHIYGPINVNAVLEVEKI
jgi:uncharacterized protein (DUF952 family)